MSDKQKNKLIPKLRFPEFKDNGEWKIDKVVNLINTITPPKKLKTKDYLEEGKFPIIDQSQSYYCGWTNDIEAIISDNLPLIIFGDHTCILKIIQEPFAQGADGIKILKTKENVTSEFLFHFLQHYGVKQENYKRHFSKLKEKIVFFPDIKTGEQQKIASFLSNLDKLIEAHNKKLDLLKRHKKGLMQNLFPQEGEKVPKLRFPEFKDSGEWEEKILSKITDYIFDGTHQTPRYIENGIPFFSVENIISGNKNKFISHEDYEIATKKNKPEKGDILITRIGKIGYSAIVDWDYEFSIYVTLACIKKSKHFDSYYLHSYFQSETYQKEIMSKALLNAVPSKINMNELRETKVLLPSIPEQKKIASFLSNLDKLIEAEEKKIELLEKHKKGLMQGLFPNIDE